MKTIRTDIANITSIENAIKELEAVKREWQRKANLCSETIAAMLADKISENLSAIPYSDDLIDIKTHTEIPRVPIYASYARGNTVVVEENGGEIAFIEFGAGIYHAGIGNPLADSVSFSTEIGSYGNGHGLQPYWFVKHNVISRGTPAYMPIWLSIQDIKLEIPTIVRQVFV